MARFIYRSQTLQRGLKSRSFHRHQCKGMRNQRDGVWILAEILRRRGEGGRWERGERTITTPVSTKERRHRTGRRIGKWEEGRKNDKRRPVSAERKRHRTGGGIGRMGEGGKERYTTHCVRRKKKGIEPEGGIGRMGEGEKERSATHCVRRRKEGR